MWGGAGICILLLVATTSGRPFEEENSREDDRVNEEQEILYSKDHPNSGFEGNGEDGEYFEGDIRLPHGQVNALNALRNRAFLWPGGILPYTIKTEDYTQEQICEISKALCVLMELTKVNGTNCIQIVPRSTETDYVEIISGDGCSSNQGRRGGKQTLSLESKSCIVQFAIMHEFLHALGFIHEQSRPDRDFYITINSENIKPDKKRNFEKRLPADIDYLGTPYDYKSIMHYSAYAFAINPLIPTITPRDPKKKIENNGTLSAIDIERVQIYYGCLKPAQSRFFKSFDEKLIPQPRW